MRSGILITVALALLFIPQVNAITVTDRPSAIRAIKQRNGDVYVLINPKTGSPQRSQGHGLWRFIRGDDYPSDDKYKRQYMSGFAAETGISAPSIQYSGLTVDKFARVYVFREVPDGGFTSLLDLTNVHPQSPVQTLDAFPDTDIDLLNSGGTGCANIHSQKGSPPGWVYIISDDGKEGWFKYYDVTQSGIYIDYTPNGSEASLTAAFEILPPKFKSREYGFIYSAHGGFYGGTGAYPALQVNTASAGGYCGDGSANGGANYAVWDDQPQGVPCGRPLYPMIGAFFMHPVNTGHNNSNLAAVRVCDVTKFVRKLYFDQYMDGSDLTILNDSKPHLAASATLDGPPAGNTIDQSADAIASSVGSKTTYARFNHCGDQCGAPGVQAPGVETKPGKAVGAVSSFGVNDELQRQYVLKTSTRSGKFVTSVLEIQGGNRTTIVEQLEQNGGALSGDRIAAGRNFFIGEAVGNRGSHERHIVEAWANVWVNLDGGKYILKAVQTSKRTDDMDWLYLSNPPKASFYRVSESFWGTGGINWFLVNEDVVGGAGIYKVQYNHETGAKVQEKTISIPNGSEVVAFGADGDGFVYWLERSYVETPEDLRSKLGGSAPTWKQIWDSGKLVSGSPDYTDAQLAPGASDAGDKQINFQVNRDAGLALFKTVTGGKPFLVGTIPLATAACSLTFKSRNGSRTAIGTWDEAKFATCPSPAAALQNLDVEMAVINVANPPASSGTFQMDIVDVPEIHEGKKVRFYMENPPRFDGPPAQLIAAGPNAPPDSIDNHPVYGSYTFCDSDDALRSFSYSGIPLISGQTTNGYVMTVTNYISSGNDVVLDWLDANDGNGTGSNLYKDNDGIVGMNLPSFVWTDIPSVGCAFPMHNQNELVISDDGLTSSKVQQNKTLRVRWSVRALTPPMSLQTGHPNVTAHFGTGPSAYKCFDPVAGNFGLKELESPSNIPGMIYYECYKDIPIFNNDAGLSDTDGDGVPDQTMVVSPEIEFPDPGVYEIKLSMVGFRWVADNLTFEDDSDGVTYEVTESVARYIVNVHPKQVEADGYVQDLFVMNQSPTGANPPAPHNGVVGPAMGGHNKVQTFDDHMVVVEDEPVPVVAEATIDFFRAVDKKYMDDAGSAGKVMAKFDGVGAWDYRYPGAGWASADPVPAKIDKRADHHPPNFDPVPSSKIRMDMGNDATNDHESHKPSNDAGIPRYTGSSSGMTEVEHISGTRSLDSYYTGGSMATASEAMFDWWEIKYYWFVRYKDPVTGDKMGPFLIRRGNLSEIWALHNFGHSSDTSYVAPTHFKGADGGSWANGEFIKKTTGPRGERRYKVRVPLMQNTLCHRKGGPFQWGDEDCVVDLKNTLGTHDPESASGTMPVSSVDLFRFPIPTEPTALEFSFFLDYPRVKWMPRNPTDVGVSAFKTGLSADNPDNIRYGPSGTQINWDPNLLQDGATYFDLVYWGPASESKVTGSDPFPEPDPMDLMPSVTESPGPNDFRIGGTDLFGNTTPLDPIGNSTVPVLLWGNDPLYKIGNTSFTPNENKSGGLTGTGDYDRPSGGSNDHWFDVIIRDNTSPSLSAASEDKSPSLTGNFGTVQDLDYAADGDIKTGFTGVTGGQIQSDRGMFIAAIDNNPYQHWESYDANLGSAGSLNASMVEAYSPFVQQVYYEIGADPRNLLGLGLQTGGASKPCVPGYFVSRPLNPADAESSYGFDDWEDQLLRNIPGEEFFADAIADQSRAKGCNYRYPGDGRYGFSLSDHNERFFTVDAPDSASLTKPFMETGNQGFARPTSPKTSTVPTLLGNEALAAEGNAHYVLQMQTDVGASSYGGAAPSNKALYKFIEDPDFYSNMDGSTLSINLDTESTFNHLFDPRSAYRISYWWIPQDALILPYYLNPASGGTDSFTIYAKAYDFSRYSMKSHGVPIAREDVGPQEAFNDMPPGLASVPVGTFKVTDNRPPNVKITFFDYKETQLFRVLLLDDYAHDYAAADPENATSNVVILRTLDPRTKYYDGDATQADWSSGRIPEAPDGHYRLYHPHSILKEGGLQVMADPGLSGNRADIFNVKIAEDVRFRIKVEATDNSSAPQELTVKIESDFGDFDPTRTTDPVEEIYRFPTINMTTKIYQYQGFATGYHLYPKKGFYDVIKVTVSDKLGNTRMVSFPIEITEQNVHFRSLGDESKVR